MEETLKMMKQIIIGNEGEKSTKELIEEYQKTKSPNILAYIFVKNYGLIYKTSQLYDLITSEDKASFCLQELDRCLLNYNKDVSQFMTYFCKCYSNLLRGEHRDLVYNKRKILNNYIDLSDCENKLSSEDIYDFSLEEFQKTYKLTDLEFEQCNLLEKGYKIKEIGQILKKSTVYIYKRNLKIKEKILENSINFG